MAKILLVDDNKMICDMLKQRLERKGYRVLTTQDGKKAVQLNEQESFDLILLDITMPKICGLEILKNIRQRYSATELPVIMVSARDQSEDMVAAFQQGANDYVTKPINFPVALARIQAHLLQKEEIKEVKKGKQALKVGGMFLNYQIVEKLGTGGMGSVYKAYDTKLKRSIALKVLLEESNHLHTKRLIQEAQAIAQISHPNIVAIFETGNKPINYFTMKFIEGQTLEHFIQTGQITQTIAVIIAQKISSALHAAHQKGVIHRDLKPSNIMIDNSGEPYLMDFGVAKIVDSEQQTKITKMGQMVGTPSYMAPEQIDARFGEIDPTVDIYSLGTILYEMLTGQLPFESSNIAQLVWQIANVSARKPRLINPQVSEQLEEICLTAMAKEKSERYTNAKMLSEKLKKFLWR